MININDLFWLLRCKISYCLFRLNYYFTEIGLIKSYKKKYSKL